MYLKEKSGDFQGEDYVSWLFLFGFENLARLGHWMFALGIQCISDGVRDLCGQCELV